GGKGRTVVAMRITLCAIAAAFLSLPAFPALPAQTGSQPTKPKTRLFPPLSLGELETPDRVLWNKPDVIMDALNIADGSIVADLGAGGGWFTALLAQRVGPKGLVYAEDIQRDMIQAIKRRIQRENLTNVRPVLGTTKDSNLPHGLDAVVIVGAYNEMEDPVALLKDAAASLKPQGRIGIVEYTAGAGGPGPDPDQRVSPETVIKGATAAGLPVVSQQSIPPFMYMIILGKGSTSGSAR
ncbi:MAG TPA: methyltransferase domain-containing protein, partial [Vicinamibacterales bacterium]|nr:methyltransferase domain-containing protein [Vicinamibacterales bacterium]